MEEELKITGEPEFITQDRQRILEQFKDLEFYEEGHKYFLHGQELPSVSKVVHQYEPEFDSESVAKRYAAKNGRTPQEWIDIWAFKNKCSTVTGTAVHCFGESLFWLNFGRADLIPGQSRFQYVPEKNWMIPTRPKEEAALKYHREMNRGDWPVLAETKVYNNFGPEKMKTSYCGTFDILYYRQDLGGYVIKDYKTNKTLLASDYDKAKDKRLLEPFSELPKQPLSIYTLQLSLYQIPLEDLGLKVVAREIIWLKDDATYEVIQLPDYTKKLREII